MSFARATTSWGLLATMGIVGYTAAIAGRPLGRAVPFDPPLIPGQSSPPTPQTPAAPPTAGKPYALAWSDPIASTESAHVVVGQSFVVVSSATGLAARARDDGRALWTTTTGVQMLVLVGDAVVAASTTHLSAHEQATGRARWTLPLPDPIAGLSVTPAMVLAAAGRRLTAYRLADGVEAWHADLDASITAAPAAGASGAFVTAGRMLVAFDLGSGRILWRSQMEGTAHAIAIAAERVILSADGGSVCSYKLRNGAYDWCFPVGVPIVGTAVSGQDDVLVAFLDNQVRRFDLRTGALRQRAVLNARPIAGPVPAGSEFMVPLVDAQVAFLSRDPRRELIRVASPDHESSPSLQSASVDPAGETMAMITTAFGGRSLLSVFRKARGERPEAKESVLSPRP